MSKEDREGEKGMAKFLIKTKSVELSYKQRLNIKKGVAINSETEELILKEFESEEEALKALPEYAAITVINKRYVVEEYYAAKCEYKYNAILEDYEEVEEEILETSDIAIELVETPSYRRVAIFNNLKEAEEAEDDYYSKNENDDNEVFLNF